MRDAQLVQATLRGDVEAFAELARRYYRALSVSTRHLVGRPEDAEDLTQEALVKAYQRLGELHDAEKFRPWLFAIARHICLNHLERRAPDADRAAQSVRNGRPGSTDKPCVEVRFVEIRRTKHRRHWANETTYRGPRWKRPQHESRRDGS